MTLGHKEEKDEEEQEESKEGKDEEDEEEEEEEEEEDDVVTASFPAAGKVCKFTIFVYRRWLPRTFVESRWFTATSKRHYRRGALPRGALPLSLSTELCTSVPVTETIPK
uniref:Uncharacterized protein n=1 Tax=Vespula pensylvanica TaxID=30213 RepID=A0A834UFH3_VESPE|nr:hypothetical protein H0235_003616 [Vespula pensylvanica]